MLSQGSLLIVDIDRSGVFPADQLALALGYEKFQLVHTAADAMKILSLPGAPSYVVMDIGVHGDDMFPVLSSLAKACGKEARLVVVGNINDLAFYRALRNLGIAEYFTHPASVAEIKAALVQRTASDHAGQVAGSHGSLTVFMSAASGDGASTVALNTAYVLAQDTRQPTVMVDLDYQFGMVARHLDLQAEFGIRELFDHPDRGVDATLVRKMLLQYNGGLNVIAAPDTLRPLPPIRPEAVRDLMAVLKSQFAHVMVDVPHLWTPWTAEALAQADRIIIVSQLWLRSLTHLSRLRAAMQEAGIDKGKIWLAVNRSGARFREAITPQDFERVCLKTIDFYFANDIKTIVGAENQGKTVAETGASLLERQFRDLGRAISGQQAESSSPVQKTGGIMQFFKQGK